MFCRFNPAIARFVIVLSLSALSVACASVPVYNVLNAPVSKSYELDTMKQAIVRACQQNAWQWQTINQHSLRAEKHSAQAYAAVNIDFAASSFTIRYHDSRNLGYDGLNIEPRYNAWIAQLEQTIQQQLDTVH